MGKKRARPVVDSAPAQPTQRADGATGKKKAAGPKKALASGEGEVPPHARVGLRGVGYAEELGDAPLLARHRLCEELPCRAEGIVRAHGV